MIPIFATGIYGFIVAYLMQFHEVWRDEMHSYSMAIGASSYWDIFRVLRECNEGHPMLWHVLLRFFHGLTHTPQSVQIASIAVACLAMYVFFRFAPFRWPEKILFSLGYFPLFEYSVIARSYGLVMLFIFIFCALYSSRFKNIIPIALILCLMANTVVHGLIVAFIFSLSLAFEFLNRFFIKKEKISSDEVQAFVVAGILLVLGFVFAIAQIVPTHESIIKPNFNILDVHILKCMALSVVGSGKIFSRVFNLRSNEFWILTYFIFALGVLLWRRPFVWMIWAGVTVALGTFFQWGYSGSLRHLGIYYLCFIAVIWIFWEDSLRDKRPFSSKKGFRLWVNGQLIFWIFWIALAMQLRVAYEGIRQDIYNNYSSSKSFGTWLKQNPQFKNAILIGEPDYVTESMVYYCENKIYNPRQKQFTDWVTWTNINQRILSLDELLKRARAIKEQQKTPVLIVLGHTLGDGAYEELSFGYSRIFTYTKEQKKVFLSSTRELAEFTGSYLQQGEDYKIYLVL